MFHTRPLTIAIGLSALLGLGACSVEEKFCPKMKELYGERMNDCETDALPELKKHCKNAEAVMECMVGAADKDAADKCVDDKCEKN